MNSVRYLSENWPLQIRASTDGVRALWRELNRYSGRDASERAFAKSRGDSKFEEPFRNAIRLADEYFSAYEDSSEVVDPVLLYYGAMWLGNAVIYVTLTRPQIEGRDERHGITPNIADEENTPFLKARVNIQSRNATYNLTNMAFGGDDLSGNTFEVLDLLAAIPEMDEHLQQPIARNSVALRITESPQDLKHWTSEKGTIEVFLDPKKANEGYFRDNVAIYAYLAERNVQFAGGTVTWERSRPGDEELRALTIFSNASRFLLPKLRGLVFSEPSLYIGVIHALSELARYHPEAWIKTIDKGGDEYFIIRQFMHLAESKLPLLALNQLSRAEFLFPVR